MINFGHALEIAALLLAAYLAGCGFGYWAHRAVQPKPVAPARFARRPVPGVPQPAPPPHSPARRLARLAGEPAVPPRHPPDNSPPRPIPPDDLCAIKGVGPKTQAALNALGIHRFEQIALWSPEDVARLEARRVAVKGRIQREQWIAQALLLATATEKADR